MRDLIAKKLERGYRPGSRDRCLTQNGTDRTPRLRRHGRPSPLAQHSSATTYPRHPPRLGLRWHVAQTPGCHPKAVPLVESSSSAYRLRDPATAQSASASRRGEKKICAQGRRWEDDTRLSDRSDPRDWYGMLWEWVRVVTRQRLAYRRPSHLESGRKVF